MIKNIIALLQITGYLIFELGAPFVIGFIMLNVVVGFASLFIIPLFWLGSFLYFEIIELYGKYPAVFEYSAIVLILIASRFTYYLWAEQGDLEAEGRHSSFKLFRKPRFFEWLEEQKKTKN